MNKLSNKLPKPFNELPIEISLQTNPSIEFSLNDICWNCGGTGELKAMQNLAVIGSGSVMGPDTTTKCNFCNGTGRK